MDGTNVFNNIKLSNEFSNVSDSKASRELERVKEAF
jgi:hypothetical protein